MRVWRPAAPSPQANRADRASIEWIGSIPQHTGSSMNGIETLRSVELFRDLDDATLAELATEVEIGQAFVDKLLVAHVRGDEIVSGVSMAKWWTTELQKRLTGECLQLHGGYGFMAEYPISGDYADAAVQSIYAGSNEIMKVIIARRLGLD